MPKKGWLGLKMTPFLELREEKRGVIVQKRCILWNWLKNSTKNVNLSDQNSLENTENNNNINKLWLKLCQAHVKVQFGFS